MQSTAAVDLKFAPFLE
ncbi:predicted protein [Fibroporia radiculosa]|uniref:Uncharacterized protein n=1 Tax=Fibroporia radiculosa TaxID=599839 RepID=J7SD15_9APHY|nr:predicted protein [Fibroporia radiculosa]